MEIIKEWINDNTNNNAVNQVRETTNNDEANVLAAKEKQFDKEFSALCARDDTQLKQRILQWSKNNFAPIGAWKDRDGDPHYVFINIMRAIVDDHGSEWTKLLERMKEQVISLLHEFDNSKDGDNDCFVQLLLLSYEWKITNAWDMLLEKIASGTYKWETYFGARDLQQYLYAVAYELTQERSKIENALKNDVLDARYGWRAYRYLCEIDVNNSFTYLPNLVTSHRERGSDYEELTDQLCSITGRVPGMKEILLSKMEDTTFTAQFDAEDLEMLNKAIEDYKLDKSRYF